jgi:hypothetical protein
MLKTGWNFRLLGNNRLFPVSIFLFAVIVHLPYLVPGGPSPRYTWPLKLVCDEGTALYDAFRITSGEVIYRDFFQFQGPVFYYLYAGIFAFTGPSMEAARAMNILITAFTATIIAMLIARSLGTIISVGAAVVHICLLVPMWPYAYPHWLAEALVFLGLYFLISNNESRSHKMLCGACFGLSAATIQSLGLPILSSCMVCFTIVGIMKRNWKEALLRPLQIFIGALLGVAPFILHLGLTGALESMWYAMFEWVFTHYPEGQIDAAMRGYGAFLESYIIAHARIHWPWRELAVACLNFIKLLPLLGLIGAIVVTVKFFINKRQQPSDNTHLIIGVTVIAGTIPIIFGITRADLTHVAFVGSFGLCGTVIFLSSLTSRNPRFRLPIVFIWSIIGILVLANYGVKTIMTYQPSKRMQNWRGEVLKLGMARWIDSHVSTKERIVVADMGGLQYLYIRRSAVGFTFIPGNTPRYFSDEQWIELGRQILKALPPVIDLTQAQWLQVTERIPELEPLYQRNNRLLLRVGFTPRN